MCEEYEDKVVPTRIEHQVDTDLLPGQKKCSYHYNFLLYTFELPGGEAVARAYLDTPNEVSLLRADIDGEELEAVIEYLKWRYKKVLRNTSGGYQRL
jgi:hypothetical protein